MLATASKTTNFVITGQYRSGAAVLQSALANRTGVACHANLFHPDSAVRQACHADYYGPADDHSRFPECFEPVVTSRSAQQYLLDSVLNHPLHDELVIGVRLPYQQLMAYDLFDTLLNPRIGIRTVHVWRNPLACFISLGQAARRGYWQQPTIGALPLNAPLPVHVDPEEAIEFVRLHEATAGKLRQSRQRAGYLEIGYEQLLARYDATLRTVLTFLGLSSSVLPRPSTRQIRQRGDFSKRVTNWTELQRVSALRGYLRDPV